MKKADYDSIAAFYDEGRTLPERTSSARDVEDWLRSAGFQRVHSREIVQQTYLAAADHLAAARAKSTSVLTLIAPEAFDAGIENLAAEIEARPGDPWFLHDRMTLTVGIKP